MTKKLISQAIKPVALKQKSARQFLLSAGFAN